MTDTWDHAAWLADRREALLSLDVVKMRAYARRYGIAAPESDQACLIAMHKARCEAIDIPLDEQIKSLAWLDERGFKAGLR